MLTHENMLAVQHLQATSLPIQPAYMPAAQIVLYQ